MLKIGLTGGIGSGKSTVANLFRLKSVEVIDADKIARDVVEPGSPAINEIAKKFGSKIINTDGSLNRAELREIVFADEQQLHWLNRCLHPIIRKEILSQVNSATGVYVILDVPLLFENKLNEMTDRVLVVDLPEAMQIARVAERDKVSEESVREIMARQVSREYRLSHADDLIDNSGSIENLKKQVNEMHQKYRALAENW